MPKPFLRSVSANATATRRVASGIKPQYHQPSSSQTSNTRRCNAVNTRQCRCHCRSFSQLTPKPLARLHDRRDIDAIFFSRSSSITLHSNRQKDEKYKNRVTSQAGQTGHTVRYDLPPGTEGVGGGDHKPPDERVLRLGKSTSLSFYLQRDKYTNRFVVHSSEKIIPPPPQYPHPPTPHRTSLPANHPPPLPLHASAFTERQGTRTISCRPLDGPCGMEQSAAAGKCETPDSVRAHGTR